MKTPHILLLALASSMAGCATLDERGALELTWQSLHAIDTAQTIHIARAPSCFYEKNWLTSTIVGRHPDEADVAAVMLGYSMLHYFISQKLGELEDPRPLRVFQAVTLLQSGYNVVHNHSIGLRPFGSGGCR